MDCSNVQIKYAGDGSQVLYTFPFEYMDETDVKVGLWNNTTARWEHIPAWLNLNEQPTVDAPYYWTFDNATTIRFLSNSGTGFPVPPPDDWAPPAPTEPINEPDGANIIIRRDSYDNELVEFFPGSSIRAQDLNFNYDQLLYLIQENRCIVSNSVLDYLNSNYWSKLTSETTYSNDDWDSEADDLHVPTTGAIDKHIDDTFIGNTITEQQQKQGEWKASKYDTNAPNSINNNDTNIPSTAAGTERWDNFYQRNSPTTSPYQIPGKQWFDNDELKRWSWDSQAQVWVDFGTEGPQGPKGDTGSAYTIISDKPPVARLNGRAIEDGDFWFDSATGRVFIAYTDPDCGNRRQWLAPFAGGPQGPKGDTGDSGDGVAATVDVGTTTTGAAGTQAQVTNSGDTTNAIFDFVIPKGDQGDQGNPGTAATVDVGTTTTGAAGTDASVTNVGDTTNAIFNFVIPRGADGTGGGGGIPEAPIDGQQYARQDAGWTVVTPPASTLNFLAPLEQTGDDVTFSWSSMSPLP